MSFVSVLQKATHPQSGRIVQFQLNGLVKVLFSNLIYILGKQMSADKTQTSLCFSLFLVFVGCVPFISLPFVYLYVQNNYSASCLITDHLITNSTCTDRSSGSLFVCYDGFVTVQNSNLLRCNLAARTGTIDAVTLYLDQNYPIGSFYTVYWHGESNFDSCSFYEPITNQDSIYINIGVGGAFTIFFWIMAWFSFDKHAKLSKKELQDESATVTDVPI